MKKKSYMDGWHGWAAAQLLWRGLGVWRLGTHFSLHYYFLLEWIHMPNYFCLVRARLVVFQRYPIEKQEPKDKRKAHKVSVSSYGHVPYTICWKKVLRHLNKLFDDKFRVVILQCTTIAHKFRDILMHGTLHVW